MTMTKAASYWDQITAQRISRRRALQMAAVGDDVNWQNVAPVNGRKVDANDVVYSFNRYRSISPNKANLAVVDTITASGDGKQVTFKLKEPFGLFLNRIASFQDLWIMPKEFIESSENAAEERMLGSGAFIFDHYTD